MVPASLARAPLVVAVKHGIVEGVDAIGVAGQRLIQLGRLRGQRPALRLGLLLLHLQPLVLGEQSRPLAGCCACR